jgi:tRNA pseudouridine38-40 synthase
MFNVVTFADSFPSISRAYSSFPAIMEKAIEEQKEKKLEKMQAKPRKERYNGKFKRRDWVEETEEAKKARLEAFPPDKVKRKKALVLLGYSGVNYHGMQRNPDVKTIEEAFQTVMLKHGWMNEEGFNNPQQAFFQRAARTDKGVSAARQVVSLKLRKHDKLYRYTI